MSGTAHSTPTSEIDGRSTRWNAHNRSRRRRILDAAIEVIETDGPDVSVQQIADRVGLPRPVVYRHFTDRDDLDEQIRAHIVEIFLADLTPALSPEGTALHAIRHAVDTYLGWIETHPKLHQ